MYLARTLFWIFAKDFLQKLCTEYTVYFITAQIKPLHVKVTIIQSVLMDLKYLTFKNEKYLKSINTKNINYGTKLSGNSTHEQ